LCGLLCTLFGKLSVSLSQYDKLSTDLRLRHGCLWRCAAFSGEPRRYGTRLVTLCSQHTPSRTTCALCQCISAMGSTTTEVVGNLQTRKMFEQATQMATLLLHLRSPPPLSRRPTHGAAASHAGADGEGGGRLPDAQREAQPLLEGYGGAAGTRSRVLPRVVVRACHVRQSAHWPKSRPRAHDSAQRALCRAYVRTGPHSR
jgi:hypothetical protein